MTHARDPRPSLSWEDQPVFRELFLVHAPPLVAVALQEAGRSLYDELLEGGPPAGDRASGERWVHARVDALARDLRFTARVLGSLAEEPTQASLDPEEMALAMKSGAWAREAEELARALEAAAGSGPGRNPGPGGCPGAGPAGAANPGKETP